MHQEILPYKILEVLSEFLRWLAFSASLLALFIYLLFFFSKLLSLVDGLNAGYVVNFILGIESKM